MTGQASVSNVEDAHKALRVVQRYCDAPSSELRLVRDLRRWDLHMNVVGESCGRGMLGMAMVAAVLALACGRTLEPRLIFAAVSARVTARVSSCFLPLSSCVDIMSGSIISVRGPNRVYL